MSLESFLKKTALDPLKRMADDAINKFTNELTSKFENEVNKLFTKGLKSLGLSNSIASKLASRFGDALVNELADEFFKSASSEANRLSKQKICDNFAPRFAETVTNSVDRVTKKLKSASNVSGDTKQFPLVLGKYYMSMRFKEYTRTAPFAPMTQRFKNAIILPIPRSLEDQYSINIQTKELGGVGAAADIAMALDRSDGNFSVGSQAGALGLMFANKIAESANIPVAGNIGAGVQDVGGQLLGTIPNPHVAAIFQGMNLREHSFDWTFAPRNRDESQALQEIILMLQQNSLPAYSKEGTAALEYPHLCQIDLYPWAGDNTPLIKFKPAMLKNVSINYSPNGIPSFFAGTNLPTFVSIKLTFIETEYFTSNDYGRGGREDSKLSEMVEAGKDFVNAISDGWNGTGENTGVENAQPTDGPAAAPPPPPPAQTSAPSGQISPTQLRNDITSMPLGSPRTWTFNDGTGTQTVKLERIASQQSTGSFTNNSNVPYPLRGYSISVRSGNSNQWVVSFPGTEAGRQQAIRYITDNYGLVR